MTLGTPRHVRVGERRLLVQAEQEGARTVLRIREPSIDRCGPVVLELLPHQLGDFVRALQRAGHAVGLRA